MFRDFHTRAHWTAMKSFGQMCADFGLKTQVEFHELFVNSLFGVMGDAAITRVQSHTTATVLSFCAEATGLIVALYLNRLSEKLQAWLQSPHRITRKQAGTAIAAIPDSGKTQVFNYFDWFMTRLK